MVVSSVVVVVVEVVVLVVDSVPIYGIIQKSSRNKNPFKIEFFLNST